MAICCSRSRRFAPQAASWSRKRPAAAAPMHDYLPIAERDSFYHLCQRRPRSWPARRGRRCAGKARTQSHRAARRRFGHVLDSGAMDRGRVRAAGGLHHRQQRELPRARGIRHGTSGSTRCPELRLPHLDFCALAAGHGVQAVRVDRCEDLDAALRSRVRRQWCRCCSKSACRQMNERTGSLPSQPMLAR